MLESPGHALISDNLPLQVDFVQTQTERGRIVVLNLYCPLSIKHKMVGKVINSTSEHSCYHMVINGGAFGGRA